MYQDQLFLIYVVCLVYVSLFGPKTNYFSFFMSFCTNRIAVFRNFFSLICSQARDKQNHAHDFFPFEYFLNNQLLIVFIETTLSKLVELLL